MSRIFVEMIEEEYQEYLDFKKLGTAKNDVLDLKVEDCFNIRASNCLRRGITNTPNRELLHIKTIRDLTNYTERQIASIRNLGRKSLKEIKCWLETHNLSFKGGFVNEQNE